MDFFKRQRAWVVSFVFAIILCGTYALVLAAPTDFPSDTIVVIAERSSAPDVARQLASAHVIRHSTILRFILRVSGSDTHVRAGAYRFDTPENVFTVAHRLAEGDYHIPPVRITFVEGTTVLDYATQVAEVLPRISATDFMTAGKRYEGYLFPDTYTYLPDSDTDVVIAALRENFNKKIEPLSADIAASGHSLSDIIIMASLVEKEARTSEVRKVVAGILWNRLARNMPLQVDAVFGYIYGRDTYSPSFADLKIDSPYNTYIHSGLPPGPINNPGLDSIEAVLHPTKTNYLYYLVDKNGLIHYATTYAAHQANQQKYLH